MADPGFPVGGGGGGANLRRIHFSAKTYAKMKEIDPVGGGEGARRGAPPGSANDNYMCMYCADDETAPKFD